MSQMETAGNAKVINPDCLQNWDSTSNTSRRFSRKQVGPMAVYCSCELPRLGQFCFFWGPFVGPVYKGGVLYWGPKKRP